MDLYPLGLAVAAGAGEVASWPHAVATAGALGVPRWAVGVVAGLPGLGRPLVPLGVWGDPVTRGTHPNRSGA